MTRDEWEAAKAEYIADLAGGWLPREDEDRLYHDQVRLTCVDDACHNGTTVHMLAANGDDLYRAMCGHCRGPLHAVLIFDDEEQDLGLVGSAGPVPA